MTGLSQALGSAVSPAVYVVPCVRFNCFVRLSFTSSTVATLGMSGWLDLPQQGLSSCKKRQASLGALTSPLTCRRPTVSFQLMQSRKRAAVRWNGLLAGAFLILTTNPHRLFFDVETQVRDRSLKLEG